MKDFEIFEPDTEQVLVESKDEQLIFRDLELKEILKQSGIPIPFELQSAFHNQRLVEYGSPNFYRAFHEIYYPKYLEKLKLKIRYI